MALPRLSYRFIPLRGSNGRLYPFHFQSSGTMPTSAASDDRMAQLFGVVNSLLSRHKETRRRNIAFSVPNAVSFSPSTRILQADSDVISFQQIYEDYCLHCGIPTDGSFMLHRKIAATPSFNVRHTRPRTQLTFPVTAY